MLQASTRFQESLVKSHRAVVDIRITRNGELLWTGGIADGSVSMDPDAKLYRSASMTINLDEADIYDLIPTLNGDALAPFGTQIEMKRGIEWPDGTRELIPLGVVVLEKTRTIDSGQGLQLKLTGKDLGYKASKTKFTIPWTIANGTWYGQALFDMFRIWCPWARWEGSVWNTIPTGYTASGVAFDQGSEVWEAAYKMATDVGYRLYFNENGNLDLARIPADDVLAKPVWNFVEGDGGTLLYVDKEFTVENTYNWIVVTGNPSGATPVSAGAVDNDPNSPTYINGPYGRVPMFYSSPFITTTAQAQAVADRMLWRRLGGSENIHIQALVAPHIEPDDIVWVERLTSKTAANYRVNKVTIPLTNDRAMDVTMSTRRIPT